MIKKDNGWSVIIGSIFFVLVGDAFGKVGAAGWGSGGSFLGSPGGVVESLFWNPAGLAYLRQRQLLFSGLLFDVKAAVYTQAYICGFTLPEKLANVAIGYLKTPPQKDGYVHEKLVLGVGGVGSGIFKDIALGLSLRQQRIEYYKNSLYIDSDKVTLVDIGLLYKFVHVMFGILVENFNSQSVEFVDGTYYKFERKVDCGLSYSKDNFLYFVQLENFVKQQTLLSFGGECRPTENFAIRLGRHVGEYDTFGIGYSLTIPAFKCKVSVDYALKFSRGVSVHICDLRMSF